MQGRLPGNSRWTPKITSAMLPVHQLREIHITGIQILDNSWMEKLRRAGLDDQKLFPEYLNQPIDHLPMVDEDWAFFQWALEQIQDGHWREPEIIAFEYSGIGKGFFQATTDTDILQTRFRAYMLWFTTRNNQTKSRH